MASAVVEHGIDGVCAFLESRNAVVYGDADHASGL